MIFLFLAGHFFLQAQSLKKYDIGTTGCKLYMLCDPGKFDLSYSQDSSKVYTAECKANDALNYGVICVELKEALPANGESEDMLISYMDYLKTGFNISSSAGYGKGHTMKNYEEAIGVMDYWKDKDNNEWKVKGWTDGKFISVLYVYSNGKLDETPKVNLFLDGFRFKGMQ